MGQAVDNSPTHHATADTQTCSKRSGEAIDVTRRELRLSARGDERAQASAADLAAQAAGGREKRGEAKQVGSAPPSWHRPLLAIVHGTSRHPRSERSSGRLDDRDQTVKIRTRSPVTPPPQSAPTFARRAPAHPSPAPNLSGLRRHPGILPVRSGPEPESGLRRVFLFPAARPAPHFGLHRSKMALHPSQRFQRKTTCAIRRSQPPGSQCPTSTGPIPSEAFPWPQGNEDPSPGRRGACFASKPLP
jgi:hypothetical protein